MSFHLEIRDIFEIRGRGIVVLGTIESGAVRVGDELQLSSGATSRLVVVASIEKFQAPGLLVAVAGPDDVGLGISGIDREHVHVGDLLVSVR